jgi:hypothetical protein
MTNGLQPAHPLAARLILALPRQFTRRTDPAAVGVQPQTDQQLRVGMLASGAAFHCGDLRMIQAQIQSPNQFPNGAHTVLVIYQLLHGVQKQLSAINRYQSRNSGLVVDHARSLHIAASSEGFDFFTRSRRNVF